MVNRVINITAIIPARGGSKRIPQKNLIDLAGKPMIAWTIEAALKSKFISTVIVSTDNEEIATTSRKYGAEVPFLRDGKADDHSPVSLATIQTLQQFDQTTFTRPEIVVQLMANCPLRDSKDIDSALDNFLKSKSSFQISCMKYGWLNPWWAHKIDEEGKASPLFGEEIRFKRSQDQVDLFCPTGAIWIAKVTDLFTSETFYGPGYIFHPLDWKRAIDIDEYEDLEMARHFIKLK